jgi:hypothetical protein
VTCAFIDSYTFLIAKIKQRELYSINCSFRHATPNQHNLALVSYGKIENVDGYASTSNKKLLSLTDERTVNIDL